MRTEVLGSGGWMSTQRRATSAVRIEMGGYSLLLDAGTGLRAAVTSDGPGDVHVVCTHFHLDHVAGLAYLPALADHRRVVLWAPGQLLVGEDSAGILGRLIGPPYLSVPLSGFVAEIKELSEGPNDIDGARVDVRVQERHPGGSVALRVGGVVYCTDTEPDPGNIAFASGARLLIHEAWTPEDSGNGHSSARDAALIAAEAGVAELVMCHVHPLADNPAALLHSAGSIHPNVKVAHDGLVC
jgi:ribonuclease BN (tRNA processing enzyme)